MAQKVSPVPPGCHTVTPYLVCKSAGEAMDFYKKAFGAEEIARMAGPGGKVMHGELKIGDSVVFVAEEFPGMGNPSPTTLGGTTVGIHLYLNNVDAAFDKAVKAGCKAV